MQIFEFTLPQKRKSGLDHSYMLKKKALPENTPIKREKATEEKIFLSELARTGLSSDTEESMKRHNLTVY